MHQSEYLIDILVFLAAAVVVVPVFQRFRSSPILGYLAAGMAIGPHGFSFIGDTDAAQTLAHFGVVFLLFMIGLELSFGRLKTLGSKVFGLGSLQVGVTGVIIAGIAMALGLDIDAAVIIGGGLALSSTAFVLQLLNERGERASTFGLTTFSILLLQDLAVVPLLIFVAMIGTTGASLLGTLGLAALKGGAALVLVVVFGRYALKPLFRSIASLRSSELFVSTTLLMILGMGFLMSMAGLSMELGALLAGLLLAETQYRHQIEADIKPFRGLLLGLFFMTIGMAIDVRFIVEHLGQIALIVVSLMLGKTLLTSLLCRLTGLSFGTAFRVGFALSQGGEFGFVLFGAALALGLLPVDLTQILLAVITLSMVATPLMFLVGKKVCLALGPHVQTDNSLIDSDEADHILIAGFGRVGQTVAKVVSDAGLTYVAIDMDAARVGKCHTKGMSVYYGDADQIAVLNAAGAGRARAAVITIDTPKTASKIVTALHGVYPELQIFVRARDRSHMAQLERFGATEVVSEAAESSLQLGSTLLASMGVDEDEIASVIQTYRDDDYARLDGIIDGK